MTDLSTFFFRFFRSPLDFFSVFWFSASAFDSSGHSSVFDAFFLRFPVFSSSTLLASSKTCSPSRFDFLSDDSFIFSMFTSEHSFFLDLDLCFTSSPFFLPNSVPSFSSFSISHRSLSSSLISSSPFSLDSFFLLFFRLRLAASSSAPALDSPTAPVPASSMRVRFFSSPFWSAVFKSTDVSITSPSLFFLRSRFDFFSEISSSVFVAEACSFPFFSFSSDFVSFSSSLSLSPVFVDSFPAAILSLLFFFFSFSFFSFLALLFSLLSSSTLFSSIKTSTSFFPFVLFLSFVSWSISLWGSCCSSFLLFSLLDFFSFVPVSSWLFAAVEISDSSFDFFFFFFSFLSFLSSIWSTSVCLAMAASPVLLMSFKF